MNNHAGFRHDLLSARPAGLRGPCRPGPATSPTSTPRWKRRRAAITAIAIGYLRTGNVDLASIQIDRLRDAWHKLTTRFAGRRPDAFDGNPLYPKLFTAVDARLVGADMMLTSGRPKIARQSLIAIRDDLHVLRQKSGIAVLADCIADAGKAGAALMAYDKPGLDFGKPETSYAVAGKAAIYGHELARCDAMADDAVRKDAEFRRLIDGARHA